MRIAINLDSLQHPVWSNNIVVSPDTFFALAKQQPYHHFIFFSNKFAGITLPVLPNTQMVIIKQIRSNSAIVNWLNRLKLLRVLKKFNLDVLINGDQISPRLPAKNILFVVDTTFLNKRRRWRETRFHKALHGAKFVCTTTDYFKQEIIKRCKLPEQKIVNVGAFVPAIFKPVEWRNKEIIKEAYAEGYEYFMVTSISPDENMIPVLKAFSIFKKWQKTNMKLLIVKEAYVIDTDIAGQLKTFKYREDVKIFESLTYDEKAKVFAGAYGVLFLCTENIFPYPLLQAMQCETPVITSKMECMIEVGGESALYTDMKNPGSMAEHMKMIYKDEQLRRDIIASGKLRAEAYSLQKTTDLLWQAIQQAVSE